MEIAAAAFSTLMSVFVLVVFLAGVAKLFQIHTVLTEIKDSLRTAPAARPMPVAAPYVPMAAPSPQVNLHDMSSGEDMLRALDVQIKLDEIAARAQSQAPASRLD